MRAAAIAIGMVLFLGGCGGSGSGETTGSRTVFSPGNDAIGQGEVTGKLPPGAVGPTDTGEEAAAGPAATEASPGQAPAGPSASGELPASDRTAVAAAVSAYIAALDGHARAGVCAVIATCRGSLPGKIGARPANGGPAWRRSTLVSTKVERLSDGRARVSATVVHHFSDRRYVSVEDDVIYVERLAGRWVLAKPSGTLYRAVGYPSPPLRSLEPPQGW